MIKELRATLMKSQHLRAVSSGSQAQTSHAMRTRLQSANNIAGKTKNLAKFQGQQPANAFAQTLRTRKNEKQKGNRMSLFTEQQFHPGNKTAKQTSQSDLFSVPVQKLKSAVRVNQQRDNSHVNLKQNFDTQNDYTEYNDFGSRPTGPTLAESQDNIDFDVKKSLVRLKSANTTAHSQTQKNLKSILQRHSKNQNSLNQSGVLSNNADGGQKAFNAWTSSAAVNFNQTQNLQTEADLSPLIPEEKQRLFTAGAHMRQAKSTTRNQVNQQRYHPSSRARHAYPQPQKSNPEPMSVNSNTSEVRHKLYMRMVVRMTEIFGGDSRSIRIIKECLDQKLYGKKHIDAQFIDQLQNQIKARINGNNTHARSSRNLMDQNLVNSVGQRNSLDVNIETSKDRFGRKVERGSLNTNPVPSVMLYSQDNIVFGNTNQQDSPSKVWSPRGRISNAQALAAKFQHHDTSPDQASPVRSSGRVNNSRKSLPIDNSTFFLQRPEKTQQEKAQDIKEMRQNQKDEFKKNFVDVNFYGLKSNVDMGPIFQTTWNNQDTGNDNMDLIDESAMAHTQNQLQNQIKRIGVRNNQNARRYEDLSPSERNQQRSELLSKFKSNVMSMTGLDQSREGLLNKRENFSSNDPTVNKLMMSALNESDAFTQRMNQTAKSFSFQKSSSQSKFQRKSTYSKKNEKLWSLLDKYRSHHEDQKVKKEEEVTAKKTKKFADGIQNQMRATQNKKEDDKIEVQKERKDVEKETADYEKDKKKKKQLEEEKRIKIFEMMQKNIENHKKNVQNRQIRDKATDHLINPIEFQLMDKHEKMRHMASKEKKLTDDVVNRKTFYSQKLNQKQNKQEETVKGKKNEESFFERLRREDAIRQSQNMKSMLKKRQAMSYAAAYENGECLLDTAVINDLAIQDEIKANKVMQENNKKEDQEKMQKNKIRQQKMMQTSFANLSKIKDKERSLFSIQQDKNADHPHKEGNEIYATIRVKEIVQGLTQDDFKNMEKQKAQDFKKKLDTFIEQEEGLKDDNLFMGMTDAEILVNKREWMALGLM